MPSSSYPLQIPPSVALHVSHRDFEHLAANNRDLRLELTARGELIVNPPTGWETGKRNANLTYQLVKWSRDLGSGHCFDSSTGFTLANGAVRSPDAAWISQKRWDELPTECKQTFPRICPDFAIELKSQSDSLADSQAKMDEYIDNGLRLGWLLDPQSRRAEIYRAGQEKEVLARPESLSGEEVLVGFCLDLRGFWTPQA